MNWRADATFILKTARPGLWLTSIWFYLLPLGGREVWRLPGFWIGLFFVTFPLGLLLYGCNDLVDADNDRHNPRKDSYLFGARGTSAQLTALPDRIVSVHIVCLALFFGLLGPRVLPWYALLVLATVVYNWPAPGLKGRPPFEVLNQCAYLLVFVLASWLCRVPQLAPAAFVFGALFAMHSHLFGEIMDIVPDRAAGRKTTATVLGPVATKLLVASFLLGEAALMSHFFRDIVIVLFLLGSAAWFVLDALVLWRDKAYSPRLMSCFLIGWNLFALATMPYMWHTASLAR